MKWHIVYLIGPVCINGVYYPESKRIASGIYCRNCNEAMKLFEGMQKIEKVDRVFVMPAATTEENDMAVAAMYTREREQHNFIELMNALMETEPDEHGSNDRGHGCR